jgi:hypothetical protein
MSFFETVLALAPAMGLVLGVTAYRRGRGALGAVLALISVGVATVAAVLGNARPLVGLLAFGFFMAAAIAGERKRQVLALFCFSAAFLSVIIAAMYT